MSSPELLVTGAWRVKVVSWLLLLVGLLSMLVGFLAGMALGRDVPTDGSIRQVAFGPALLLSGFLAVLAWRRNRHLENRPFGLLALASIGAVGVIYFKTFNPFTLFAVCGAAVYLTPAAQADFRGPAR